MEDWQKVCLQYQGDVKSCDTPCLHCDRIAPLLKAERTAGETFDCKYRNSGMAGNDPQDCAWPGCGCDRKADQVIAHFQECGLVMVKRETLDRVFNLAATHTMQVPMRNPRLIQETHRAFDECRLALGDTER